MLNNPLKKISQRLNSRRKFWMYGFIEGYGICIERKIGKRDITIISTELQQLPEQYLNIIISIVEKNNTNSSTNINEVAHQIVEQTGELIKSAQLYVSTKALKKRWIILINPTNLPY